MTGDALREAAIAMTQRTRAEQGLPPKVEDPSAIARVVNLVRGAR